MLAAGTTTTAAYDEDENEIDLDTGEAAADVLDEDTIDLEDALEDEQALESQQGGSPLGVKKPRLDDKGCRRDARRESHVMRRPQLYAFDKFLDGRVVQGGDTVSLLFLSARGSSRLSILLSTSQKLSHPCFVLAGSVTLTGVYVHVRLAAESYHPDSLPWVEQDQMLLEAGRKHYCLLSSLSSPLEEPSS